MGKAQSKKQSKTTKQTPKGVLMVMLTAILVLTSLCTIGNKPSFLTSLFGGDSESGEESSSTTGTPTSGILLQDDFSDPESGWETFSNDAGEVGYANGVYFVKAIQAGSMIWGMTDTNFTDTSIEVTATQINGAADNSNEYGIMCRANEAGAYLFNISADGLYSIQRIDNGDFVNLVEMAQSDKINTGEATNTLKAVCSGTTLTFYVNGDKLAEATDTTYTSGDIGLTAITFTEETAEIHFDNLVVTQQ